MAKSPDFSVTMNCVCFNVQRAARQIARELDAALKPAGLTSAQFAALAVLDRTGESAVRDLAEIVGAERTTVTRNLALMEGEGFVKIRPGEDRRERIVSLTAKGKRRLEEAMPHWLRYQDCVVSGMGKAKTAQLLSLLGAVH